MAGPTTHDLGLADSAEAESIGKPGERTFRIVAKSGRGKATIWMEKEQLRQVGVSIKELTAAHPAVRNPAPPDARAAGARRFDVELRAGEMSLRHDPASDAFTLSASSASEDDDQPETQAGTPAPDEQPVDVVMTLTREHAERLADRALEAVAAGRKPCPLCGAPLDPGGHFCARKNGHRRQDA